MGRYSISDNILIKFIQCKIWIRGYIYTCVVVSLFVEESTLTLYVYGVSCSCVCPPIDHEFRHNIVKVQNVAVDPGGDSQVDRQVDPQTTLAML